MGQCAICRALKQQKHHCIRVKHLQSSHTERKMLTKTLLGRQKRGGSTDDNSGVQRCPHGHIAAACSRAYEVQGHSAMNIIGIHDCHASAEALSGLVVAEQGINAGRCVEIVSQELLKRIIRDGLAECHCG
jgi:hypothetical protein